MRKRRNRKPSKRRRKLDNRPGSKGQGAQPASPEFIDIQSLPTPERSTRTPLIYLCFFLELPFDAGLSNDQAFNAIETEDAPLEDWADFDLQAFLGMPPLREPAVRPCTVLRFRRATNEVDSPVANVQQVFAAELPDDLPVQEDLPELVRSHSVVRAIRIAPHPSGEYGEPWLRQQFAAVLKALNAYLVALGAAADDHRIAPIHELQLPPIVLGLEGDLRDYDGQRIRDLRLFLLALHQGRYGEAANHDGTVINRALAIAGHGPGGPLYPALEFLFAARRSIEEGRLTHAVLESGTAVELLVSGVVLGIGTEQQWAEEKIENVLSDKTGFRNRLGDHFAKAFGITVERDASGQDPINTWLREAYSLRNQVAHRGHRPTDDEAITAVRLAGELIDFATGRAAQDSGFGITFHAFEDLIPSELVDERSLAPEDNPSDARLAREAFAHGVQALEKGDREAARQAFAEADRHGSATASYNLGVLHYLAGETEPSIRHLRRASERGHGGAAAYLGVFLLADGKREEAEALLEQGLPPAHKGGGPVAAYFLATIRDEQGRRREAVELYRQAAAIDDFPLAPEASFRNGGILKDLGDPAALDAFRRASELGSAKGATNVGNYLVAAGRLKEAEAAHRRAIDLDDPEVTGPAAYNLAALLDRQGRIEEAKTVFELAASRGEPRSQITLAHYAIDRGDDAAVREHLLAARGSSDREASEAAVAIANECGLRLD
jgi:tetratricopeptide (TPR) repeat protein